MRLRVILCLSLAANLLFVMGWLWTANTYSRRLNRASIMPPEAGSTIVKTNVLFRRQFFTWQEVESDDYPAYIKNLRVIGCPEQTVRDIIIADVNALYARKRATEIITPDQQWWRSLPDEEVLRIATAKAAEIDAERRSFLTQLLGTNWETGDLISLPRPTRPGLTLDGPVLGILPTEVKQAVQEVHLRAQDRFVAYHTAQQAAGKSDDPAVLATMRQQSRAELAQILSPPQLEEFLLRFSETATALRNEFGQLKYFNPTAEEFRAVFKVVDAIDLQLQALGDNPANAGQRTALEQQRTTAVRAALGADRFAQMQLLQDPRYVAAMEAAAQSGNPESAGTIYEIAKATEEEQARLRQRTDLTAAQLAIELKRAELEALKGNVKALGEELPPEPEPPPKPEPQKVHVVKPGEGLTFLSRLYGINPGDLQAANPGVNFDKLPNGAAVNIPVKFLPVIPVPAN